MSKACNGNCSCKTDAPKAPRASDAPSYETFRRQATPQPEKFRPSWDEYFMAQVLAVAARSACTRRAVGAAITRDRQVISTGYNGPPAGFDHCSKTGCYRQFASIPSGQRTELCRGLHAEQNAIILAAKKGLSIDGAVIYCTHRPCITCQKMIFNAGIREIVFFADYPDADLISAEAIERGYTFRQISSPLLTELAELLQKHYGLFTAALDALPKPL